MNDPEPTPALFQHGSTWVGTDFHMHTRADAEFLYSGDPKVFPSKYIAALKAAGIRVAVVTNHNKFDRDEFKTLAKIAKKEDIFLLPGLELSVKDGSHGFTPLSCLATTGYPIKRTPTTSKSLER